MRRHKAFATREELANYLRRNAPAHAYYSTALYKNPAAAKMSDKGWLGADLIFDLDADHLVSEAELPKFSYEDLLRLVKRETEKLLDFLVSDFGFREEEVELVFSGSRGYHLHVRSDEVRGLGSRERREIVDYVGATGLEIDRFLENRTVSGGEFRSGEELRRCRYCNKITRRLACPVCGRETAILTSKGRGRGGSLRISNLDGWGKRLLRGLTEFLHEIAGQGEEESLKELKSVLGVGEGDGVGEGEKRVREMLKIAKDEAAVERIGRGLLDQIPGFSKSVWREILSKVAVRLEKSESDAPVTADTKRLIRLPGSLHGKSSLVVKPLGIAELKDFEPLEDAVAFGGSPVEVRALRKAAVKMKGERYEVKEGEVAVVPECAALYFFCRGAAEIL